MKEQGDGEENTGTAGQSSQKTEAFDKVVAQLLTNLTPVHVGSDVDGSIPLKFSNRSTYPLCDDEYVGDIEFLSAPPPSGSSCASPAAPFAGGRPSVVVPPFPRTQPGRDAAANVLQVNGESRRINLYFQLSHEIFK